MFGGGVSPEEVLIQEEELVLQEVLTQARDRSSRDCLVTPGRMIPSRGGVTSSFSADAQTQKHGLTLVDQC